MRFGQFGVDVLADGFPDARRDLGFLRGSVTASVGNPDAERMPYDLQLELKLRGEGKNAVLNGGVVARSRVTRQRIGHALTHWAQLTRRGEQ